HAQAHGYWTGYPYEQAAERIANTGRLRQQSTFIIGDVCVSRHFRLRSQESASRFPVILKSPPALYFLVRVFPIML
ncbi:MAG: hypothetical protein SOY73_05395, partial [Blautia sp.]|nr:hypothetical protein [Blautia sp.]MDY3998520.1 hypothetical protein [Blautia sp.]